MSVLDITNNIQVEVAFNALISANGTNFTSSVNMIDFNNGFMFTLYSTAHSDGTYELILQDSPDDSVWTDIPAEKLNDPGGLGSITLVSTTSPGDLMPSIGAFSSNKFVRGKIISTLVTSGANMEVIVSKMADKSPV